MIRKNMSRCKRETASVFYETIVKPLRLHLALNGKTPAEVAGIDIEGDNKILTMIRAAAKSNAY